MSTIENSPASYQIADQTGKGRMGKIHQAKGIKLERDSAIQVLPEEFAKDADHAVRFQRDVINHFIRMTERYL